MSADSDGLVARLRNLSGARQTPDVVSGLRPASDEDPDLAPLAALQARVAHLEQLVQGLQDSVYREAQRHDRRVSELEGRLDPAALATALEQEARDRRV